MWLNNMTKEQKAKVFELIVEQTEKKPCALKFGRDVYMIVKYCAKTFKFK